MYLARMAIVNPSNGALTFDPVWLILRRVRPTFRPGKFLAPGKLVITDGRVEFSPSGAKLRLDVSPQINLICDHVTNIRLERYGWGLVPRYVAVTYESPEDGKAVARFNDASWLGWRPLLTYSNARIVKAMRKKLDIE